MTPEGPQTLAFWKSLWSQKRSHNVLSNWLEYLRADFRPSLAPQDEITITVSQY